MGVILGDGLVSENRLRPVASAASRSIRHPAMGSVHRSLPVPTRLIVIGN